ncbi:uncharacterized protein LOC120648022 [Panicum virgatum]|uniref:uncharacterized protein LOC120648022 n=1 Tax=Panicum virgatum TaxID=38727 RepID=UPI0019D67C12|nr:uncharacterized protein LOC120648022 [Panicum virgatum]
MEALYPNSRGYGGVGAGVAGETRPKLIEVEPISITPILSTHTRRETLTLQLPRPSGISIAVAAGIAPGRCVRPCVQSKQHRGRRRLVSLLSSKASRQAASRPAVSVTGVFHLDRCLHLQLAAPAEALAKAEGQPKKTVTPEQEEVEPEIVGHDTSVGNQGEAQSEAVFGYFYPADGDAGEE